MARSELDWPVNRDSGSHTVLADAPQNKCAGIEHYVILSTWNTTVHTYVHADASVGQAEAEASRS